MNKFDDVSIFLSSIGIILSIIFIIIESRNNDNDERKKSFLALTAVLVLSIIVTINWTMESRWDLALRAQYPYQSEEWQEKYHYITVDGDISSEEYDIMQEKIKEKILKPKERE